MAKIKFENTEESGRIMIRIPKSLHRGLKEEALKEGVSLNQYILYKLTKPKKEIQDD